MEMMIDDIVDNIIEVTSVDDDSGTSSSSSNDSQPFENVQPNYDSGTETECDSPTHDQFPTNMPLPFLGGGDGAGGGGRGRGAPRMSKKDNHHESFRDRKKKEMRYGSFTYKQISDDTTPTAHRKQLFSKRSACV
jgi:hypothetical protein